MVTAGTLHKSHFFNESDHLDFFQDLLLELSQKYQWKLEAWSIFSNHYHFLAHSPEDPKNLVKFITHLHANTARYINKNQNTIGRQVWHQYWDTQITHQSSYLARLNYIMQNPVKHQLVENASFYKWCSASWFEKFASKSHCDTVKSTKIDSINVFDDF